MLETFDKINYIVYVRKKFNIYQKILVSDLYPEQRNNQTVVITTIEIF